VLYGYLAAITSLELVTGVIILPQRQTALVAKQAADVDLLTEGRFRLGVGLLRGLRSGGNPARAVVTAGRSTSGIATGGLDARGARPATDATRWTPW
jgi:hypothetical protein